MTTPRIDGVRKELGVAARTLQFVIDHLEDLHVLAYDRAAARAAVDRVKGGTVDYALDNHGLVEARRLYASASNDVRRFIANCLGTADDMRDFLNNLKPFDPTITPRDKRSDSTADETVAARDARERRILGGLFTPARIVTEPEVWSQVEWQQECLALRSAVKKITDAFAVDHADCQLPPDPRHEWKRPRMRRRYQTSLLTPREREAWRRSVSDAADEKAS